MRSFIYVILTISIVCFGFGCSGIKGNVGKMPTFPVPNIEAQWIRDGETLEFEEAQWIPQDHLDILRDSEVYLLGEYRGVQFFVDKTDVRPYERLFTKFGPNKFRSFKKAKKQNDKDL